MSIIVHHLNNSRSQRILWLLEELGIPYELKSLNLQKLDQKKPDYLKLNPNGSVPTLVDGDLVIWESAAIVMYLADKHPEKQLAPAVGTPASIMVGSSGASAERSGLVLARARSLPERTCG